MKHQFFIICLLSGILPGTLFSSAFADSPVQSTQEPIAASTTKWNMAIVQQHIMPAYEALKVSTQALNESSISFCQTPNQKKLAVLQQDFKDSLAHWQAIQHIRFGPIENSLRNFRYQMWPDKRGKINKHLNKLLSEKKSQPLQEDVFPHGSIAIQGFGALEMLLFNKGISSKDFSLSESNDKTKNYRCQVVLSITKNLSKMSNGLIYDWSKAKPAFQEMIATAEQGNDYYESDREVTANLLNNLSTQLILIVDYKLDRPMGKSIKKNVPKRSESWRSRQSLSNINQNLIALEQLYQIGFQPWLENAELNEKIEVSFSQTFALIKKIDKPLFEAIRDPLLRPQLITLRKKIAQLKQLCSAELPKALDLPLGFNSLDGD